MYGSRIPPAAGDEAGATFGSVLEAHRSLSVSRRKLLASPSGLFQSMTVSKMSHLEQLGSQGQPEGWVHVW